MYTVTDLIELIRHHLVLSTDDTEAVDTQLAQLMRNIEQMISTPRWHEPYLLDGLRELRCLGVQRTIRPRWSRGVRGRWVPMCRVPIPRGGRMIASTYG